jgi:MFS transporter, DHA3 family, tetracycline resistance protein
MRIVAIPFQILALGGSAAEIGIAAAAGAAVQVPFLLFGGAVVDRLPRRLVLLASDLVRGIALSAIAFLGLTGQLRIEHLYVMAAVLGLTDAFFGPALMAIVPELVPKEILVSGNALRGLSSQGGRLGGSLVGGLLVAAFGPPIAFAIDAATFFASLLALAVMRPGDAPSGERKHLMAEVREGLAFVFAIPWVWMTIALFSIINLLVFGPMSVGLPILVRDVLRADAAVFGALTAALAVGQIGAGIVLGQMTIRRSGIVMYGFAVLAGVVLASFGAFPVLAWLLLASVLMGITFVGFNILWESALQRHVPRALLGRVTSVDAFGSFLLGPVAPLVAAALIERLGTTQVFIGAGIVVAIVSASAFLIRSIRELT